VACLVRRLATDEDEQSGDCSHIVRRFAKGVMCDVVVICIGLLVACRDQGVQRVAHRAVAPVQGLHHDHIPVADVAAQGAQPGPQEAGLGSRSDKPRQRPRYTLPSLVQLLNLGALSRRDGTLGPGVVVVWA
jgi:hypothetical protein